MKKNLDSEKTICAESIRVADESFENVRLYDHLWDMYYDEFDHLEVPEMQDRDFKWFKDNYMDLYKTYGDSYLIISNQQIVGVSNSFTEGVEFAQKKFEAGSYIVQHCNGEASGYMCFIG